MKVLDENELARKLTCFYDSMAMIVSHLDKEGKLSHQERSLAWAMHAAWATLLADLGCEAEADLLALRGGGEWPAKREIDGFYDSLFETIK